MTDIIFSDYFRDWVEREKEGAVRAVTLDKYRSTESWLRQICPTLKIKDLDKKAYQEILNEYGKTHERVTVKDFHTHLKACITEMFDERIIDRNPSLRVTFTGKQPSKKKKKFISLDDLSKLIEVLDLQNGLSRDWVILLLAKTGMRFSEVLALTPEDFDFEKLTVTVDKTWDYKNDGGFIPTKNLASIRTIGIDWQITAQLKPLIDNLPVDDPIFVPKDDSGGYQKVYNSTYNDFLARKCREAEVDDITLHGLRHTHGSVLLGQGVSILSVSKRLGHANVTTTQEVYLHITDELERKDKQLMLGALAGIR